MLSDKVRAAIAMFLGNVISGLVLFGLFDWDGEQVAILNSIVNSALIMLALIIPSNTGTTTTIQSPSSVESTTTVSTSPNRE